MEQDQMSRYDLVTNTARMQKRMELLTVDQRGTWTIR